VEIKDVSPRLGCHPSPPPLACGPLAGPKPRLWCGLIRLLWISRLLSILFLFLLWARCNSAILLLFHPNYDVFSCLSCKTSELTKAMEMVSFKLLSMLFFGEFHPNVGGVRYELRTANTHLLGASRMFLHCLLGLHLRHSLSRFNPRARVAPLGYKYRPAPPGDKPNLYPES
jgi:hypothetical protein